MLRDAAAGRTALPIGFCLDTCHLFAAGYDIASTAGLEETWQHAGMLLGWENIPVMHANDSKAPFGSHRDRHEEIGKGCIGEEPFHRMLTDPRMEGKAFVLETPVENEEDEKRSVANLWRLARK